MMSVVRTASLLTSFLLTACAWPAAAADPCNCAPGGVAYGLDGAPLPGEEEPPLPPSVILERTPCVYKPHDIDPCFNYRCHLYPPSPKAWLYVGADLAPLTRDTARDVAFQAFGPQGPSVLGTDTLELEFEGGMRFFVGGRINDLYRLETSFLGLPSWDVRDTVRDFTPNDAGNNIPGNLFSPFANFGDPAVDVDGGPAGVIGIDFNNSASISLQSTFDSAETNFLVDLPRIRNLESAVSLGGRYVRIDEDFSYRSVSFEPVAGPSSALAIRNAVNNELLGMQLGFRGRFLLEQRFWLDFDIKGAIYQNTLDHRLAYEQTEGLATAAEFTDAVGEHKTTFGGDLSLVGHYLLTPAIAVRMGYQAVWFEGLALAAENIIPNDVRVLSLGGPNTLAFAPLEIDHSGSVVYHGPVLGIVGMW